MGGRASAPQAKSRFIFKTSWTFRNKIYVSSIVIISLIKTIEAGLTPWFEWFETMQLVVSLPKDVNGGTGGGSNLAIIEMQGDLESRVGEVDMGGKLIGDLSFSKDG